ncbi:MAG: type 1 periplasmic binding fold superfamily protein [Flavobacteriales bacterium]
MKYAAAALLIASAITGCKKEEDPIVPDPPVNEEEVITTMVLSFDNTGAGADKELRFTDADGDGGGVPVYHLDTLDDASVYNVSILLVNETANPADTISNEVLNEGVDHQFFFQPAGVNISYAYGDADANGNPIGLQSTMTTGAPSAGTLMVTLRHQPDKAAAGVSGGDITNAGGETDIEVTFPVVIE